tara:strand:- start:167 stop:1291 length:1125 start_codon:yes stop_codon:yes gene_type:complete
MKNIPFSSPDIQESEIDAVNDVIRSGWLAHGEFSQKLEQLFCEYTGAKYATTVSNCTAGLHLSCLASNFGQGDEVIVPAQTHTATAHAIEFTGAKAVFADVDLVTGNILIEEVRKKISSKTKGIIPVHMAGYPCNMDSIKTICEENNLILIEDCAHAMGTMFDKKHAGNFGITGCFSFYPTKQITTGEGGMVISNDENTIEKIKKLKAFGIDTPPEMRKKPGVYDVQELGYNYRMTDIQAALGVGQMERYAINVENRRKNAQLYCDLLKDRDGIYFTTYTENNSYFLFQIFFSDSLIRNKILLSLKEEKIGTSIHYATPVPLMSYYKNKYGYRPSDFPNAVQYGSSNISLPVHQYLKEEQIEDICRTIIYNLEN